jgi:putative Holliday junction resolvase
MDDTKGERAELSLQFKESLERRTGLTVTMWDERLTTVEADDIMNEAGIKGKDRKEYVDMIAAQIILEDYMRENKVTDKQ